jgi:hypothetical protein
MTNKQPLITICWPDGKRIDKIPHGRNALIAWQDQFGTVNFSAFGDWWAQVDEIAALLQPVLSHG